MTSIGLQPAEERLGRGGGVVRMELKYCERCGALRVQPSESQGSGRRLDECAACIAAMSWLLEVPR